MNMFTISNLLISIGNFITAL